MQQTWKSHIKNQSHIPRRKSVKTEIPFIHICFFNFQLTNLSEITAVNVSCAVQSITIRAPKGVLRVNEILPKFRFYFFRLRILDGLSILIELQVSGSSFCGCIRHTALGYAYSDSEMTRWNIENYCVEPQKRAIGSTLHSFVSPSITQSYPWHL